MGKGGAGKSDCAWCAKGQCWTHGGTLKDSGGKGSGGWDEAKGSGAWDSGSKGSGGWDEAKGKSKGSGEWGSGGWDEAKGSSAWESGCKGKSKGSGEWGEPSSAQGGHSDRTILMARMLQMMESMGSSDSSGKGGSQDNWGYSGIPSRPYSGWGAGPGGGGATKNKGLQWARSDSYPKYDLNRLSEEATTAEVDAFFAENHKCDQEAQGTLRRVHPKLQKCVMLQGGLADCGDQSSVLMSRCRKANMMGKDDWICGSCGGFRTKKSDNCKKCDMLRDDCEMGKEV